jgi:hypothetical protein
VGKGRGGGRRAAISFWISCLHLQLGPFRRSVRVWERGLSEGKSTLEGAGIWREVRREWGGGQTAMFKIVLLTGSPEP